MSRRRAGGCGACRQAHSRPRWHRGHRDHLGGAAQRHGHAVCPASRGWHVLPLLAQPGWIGVQLFFALSGFLITAGLLDSRTRPHYFRDFYAKRALRIVPLYYTVLFALLVLLPWLARRPRRSAARHQAPLWFFAPNWIESSPYGFAHFWSLAVEEQFYLLWPLVVSGSRRAACCAPACGSRPARCCCAAPGGLRGRPRTLYMNTACRMDALALGGAGACVLRIPEAARGAARSPGGAECAGTHGVPRGCAATHLYDRERLSGETLGYTLLAVSSAAFVTRGRSPERCARGWLRPEPRRRCAPAASTATPCTCFTDCSISSSDSPGSWRDSATHRPHQWFSYTPSRCCS